MNNLPFYINPFKFWVQQALPTVYDDSLSYTEVLGKVVNSLNDVIKASNMTISALLNDYDPSKEYKVGDYCWYNDSIYKCLDTTTGSFNPYAWEDVKTGGGSFVESVGKDITNFKSAVTNAINNYEIILNNVVNSVANVYDENESYNVGDYVTYNGSVYKCTNATTGSFDSEDWEPIVIVDELNDYITNVLWNDFIVNYRENLGVQGGFGNSETDAITQNVLTQVLEKLNCLPIVFLGGTDATNFNWNGYECEVTQETNSQITNNIINTPHSLPNSIVPNNKYTLYYETSNTNIKLNIIWYITGGGTQSVDYTKTAEFTVPENAEGWIVRIKAVGSTTAYTGKCFGAILDYNKTNINLFDSINYNSLKIEASNGGIHLVSGGLLGNHITVGENTARISTAVPVPVWSYRQIKLPDGYTMVAYIFDKYMNLLGNTPTTATTLTFPLSTFETAGYVTFQITKTGHASDDISSDVSVLMGTENGITVKTIDDELYDKIDEINETYPPKLYALNNNVVWISGSFASGDRKTIQTNIHRFCNNEPIPLSQYKIIQMPTGYTMYGFIFDKEMNLIGNTPSTATTIRMPLTAFPNAGFVNIQVTKTGYENSDITGDLTTFIKNVKVQLYSAYDEELINDNSQNGNIYEKFTATPITNALAYSGDRIKVCSYNVARWVHNAVTTNLPDDKIFGFRNLFSKANPDFMCVQEDSPHIDNAESTPIKTPQNYMLNPVLPVKTAENYVSIKSKYNYTESNTLVIGGRDGYDARLINYGLYTVNSKTILIISAHPTGGQTADNIAARNNEYNDIFDWINGDKTLVKFQSSPAVNIAVPTCDYLIICGDMNSSTDDDKELLEDLISDNNMTSFNGGRLGWIKTTPNGSSIDNIICSNNIVIESMKTYKNEGDIRYSTSTPLSDHYMIESILCLKD